MTKDYFYGILVLLCSFLFVCSCHKSDDRLEARERMSLVDSLEQMVADSLLKNSTYSRNLLRKNMNEVSDSLLYYRMMSLYVKCCFATAQFDSVLYYNQKGVAFCQQSMQDPSICDLLSAFYNLTGNVWIQHNRPDSAIVYYKRAYASSVKGLNRIHLPDLCINLADANLHKGNYIDAAKYYRRALFLCDSLALPDGNKYPIYYGLGQTYMELRDFELSNQYYEWAGKYLPQMNANEQFTYLNNRGNHYYYKKEYAQALKYMNRALTVARTSAEMIFEQKLCKINLGELYMLTHQLDSAQLYLDESYRFFSEMKNYTAIYYIETQMIELSLRRGNVALAGRLIDRTASSNYIDVNALNIRNRYLQHYFERVGDYRQAYNYLKRDVVLNDSIRNEQVRTRVAEIDMRYRQDTLVMKREFQIERQRGELKVLRLTSYVWAAGCLLLVVVLVLLYGLMKKKRAFLQERHLNQINRLHMEKIRNQVSPHFTFNVLSREYNRFKGSEEEAANMMELIKLLRRSLELTEKLSVSLAEELDFVQTYVGLERNRLGENFLFEVAVDPMLDATQIAIPSMIIQISVENAIKHALTLLEGEKRLSIDVIGEGSGVRILITDNGAGYAPVFSSTRGTGTGLRVLYQTIRLLNAKNKVEKICFEIANLTDEGRTGTRVSVYIPYHYSYDL